MTNHDTSPGPGTTRASRRLTYLCQLSRLKKNYGLFCARTKCLGCRMKIFLTVSPDNAVEYQIIILVKYFVTQIVHVQLSPSVDTNSLERTIGT